MKKSSTNSLVSAVILTAERIREQPGGEVESPALYEAALRLSCIDRALRDAISTYTGKDKIVSGERIEAWQEALGPQK